jgi:hypothetical protein
MSTLVALFVDGQEADVLIAHDLRGCRDVRVARDGDDRTFAILIHFHDRLRMHWQQAGTSPPARRLI